ncbi:MAG: hydrogenase maturation nickel metallochaperone HypA [Lachnospiraceae bacterium]|nr:hydrogenase maturation nickel metallochaperone HypA [Lachnospiraceae bacterium]
MTGQFITIYAAFGIVIFLQIVNLVSSVLLRKKISKANYMFTGKDYSGNNSMGVVFCRKCGNQFPAGEKVCPHCGVKK